MIKQRKSEIRCVKRQYTLLGVTKRCNFARKWNVLDLRTGAQSTRYLSSELAIM